jgi:Gas vesicle synthesis protein GvpL/GvpF
VIELYAITDHPGPPLPDVAPLRFISIDGLAGICALVSEAEVSPEALWRHEELVEALMADRDLLPVRYGTRLDDEAAVARALEERRDELAAALDRVRGAVELSVRAAAPAAPELSGVALSKAAGGAEEAAGGAEYLRARARATAGHERTAKILHGPLSALARESVEGTPHPPELFRAAYLVEHDAVERFAATVARVESANPGLSLLCTGPWPPYSFAER